MYQGRFYDETLSEEEDQEMINEILNEQFRLAPIEPSASRPLVQTLGDPFLETSRLIPPETTYQVITKEVPIQANVFKTLPAENWSASLQEPLKPVSETTILTGGEKTIDLGEKDLLSDFSTMDANKDINWSSEIPVSQYPINKDPSPEIIRKAPVQDVVYTQEISIRYLRPPTPPPPGELQIM